jgi:hypothetical protein
VGIHAFRALSTVQEHGDKRNPRDTLLLANLENSLGPECVNSWQSDYNGHTNVPFVYRLASPKYYEPIKEWDVENNYDLSIPKWVNGIYPRTSLYDA